MQYTINQLREELFGNVYAVYEVFKNQFGEEFVDLQELPTDEDMLTVFRCWDIKESEHEGIYEGEDNHWAGVKSHWLSLKPQIIVWWPRVTVTNENKKSIQIQDLYAKISIDMEGKIPYEYSGFILTRSTYNTTQFRCGYCHSHVPGFYYNSPSSNIVSWQSPCLGNGPIRNTIMELRTSNEEVLWMLFCVELARYVTVESLSGGPYKMLESVGVSELLEDYKDYTKVDTNLYHFYGGLSEKNQFYKMLTEFTAYYLQHGHLCFNYHENAFVPGLPYFAYMIDISNSFIEWFNKIGTESQVENLFNQHILINSFAADGKFYSTRRTDNIDMSRYEGTKVLLFKGRDITLHIEPEEEVEFDTTILLNNHIAMYILQNILRTINYRYKNEHYTKHGSGRKPITPAYQTVCYL